MRKGRNVDVISKTSYVLEEPPAGLPWIWRVAAEHWSSRFYHPRQNKGSLLLAYIQEGSMAVTEGVSRFEAGPGSVVFVSNAHTVTALSVASPHGLRLILVIVRESAGRAPAMGCLGGRTRVFRPRDCAGVEALFLFILNAASKGYPAASDITAALLRPTVQAVCEEHAQAASAGDPGCLLFNQCREYITHHYLEIQSVGSVARRFGVSHAWLCRLFETHGDGTPYRFLLRRKMTHALYELHQHNRPVADVAYELGFADPYGFSKAFKRVMGYTPLQAKGGRRAG